MRKARHRPNSNLKVVLCSICVLLIFLTSGDFIAISPQTKLFEDIICNNHYGGVYTTTSNVTGFSGTRDENRCKAEPVQSELAIVLGWKETFEQIPGRCLIILIERRFSRSEKVNRL